VRIDAALTSRFDSRFPLQSKQPISL